MEKDIKVNLHSSESSTWARASSAWRKKRHLGDKWLSHHSFSALQSSPLIGPGLVSTSPASTSNKDSARNRDKRGVVPTFPRPHAQQRTNLPREENVPFPASHTPVPTFRVSESSSRTHNRGASEITRSRCRCSGTRGRDPQCAWYQRSFLFSQWPILARHSSGPLGGIFKHCERKILSYSKVLSKALISQYSYMYYCEPHARAIFFLGPSSHVS